MKFSQCPDHVFLSIKCSPLGPYTNEYIAHRLRLQGYEDATDHKVRRRTARLKRKGLLVMQTPSSDELN